MNTAERQLTKKAQIAAASDALIAIFDKPVQVIPTCGMSKSKFVAGMQCPKRLYLQVHRPHLAKLTNQCHKDQGKEVGLLARNLFRGGVLVDADRNHLAEAVRVTQELVNNSEVPAIFEATFRHDGVLVQVDVLRRSRKKEFKLIEVKDSTIVKPYHLQDLSIQNYVLRGAGIRVRSNHLAHLNSNYSVAALRKRDAHRQRVLDAIVKAPDISRSRFGKTWPETYAIMQRRDREWFDKALPRRRPWAAPRANRLDRGQLDLALAEKLRDIIRGLKSPSQRPVRITKSGLLRRAGCVTKYNSFSTALPATKAVLREHAETRADYLSRKIRWAVSEMAAQGQIISTSILRRKAAVPGGLLRGYKQVVLETAQQLGANVDPRSFFARDT